MDFLEYLFAGFAVFWGGIFVYLLWLQARLHEVSGELARLEERLAERDAARPAGAGASAAAAASVAAAVSAQGPNRRPDAAGTRIGR